MDENGHDTGGTPFFGSMFGQTMLRPSHSAERVCFFWTKLHEPPVKCDPLENVYLTMEHQ